MPNHRPHTCPICRFLGAQLPVDQYLALSTERFRFGCSVDETRDQDESDPFPPGRSRVVSPGKRGAAAHGRQ
jgi:hypothetical protein